MKKKAKPKKPARRGRPPKAARDRMVPIASSVPADLRDRVERASKRAGHGSRSETVVKLLEIAFEAIGDGRGTL